MGVESARGPGAGKRYEKPPCGMSAVWHLDTACCPTSPSGVMGQLIQTDYRGAS